MPLPACITIPTDNDYVSMKGVILDEIGNRYVKIDWRWLVIVNDTIGMSGHHFEELVGFLNKPSGRIFEGLLWHKSGHQRRRKGWVVEAY